MKITLVLPKYSVELNDPCCFPIGFMYISAVLKQAGHEVKVLNFNLFEYDLEEELRGQGAALFTGFEEFTEFNKTVAAWCNVNGIHTILGGAMATFAAEEMAKHFDAVIIGEGENVIETALTSCGIIIGTKPILDSIPFPDYEGFRIEEYNKRHSIKYIGVLTSRGCPYSCKFCAQTCSFQFRTLADVFKEIDIYRSKYEVTHIVFNDNTLNLRKYRFLAICDNMKQRSLTWTAAIRVDEFDEEMAKAAKESGCQYLVVGVESFDNSKLARMNKKTTSSQIHKTLDLLEKYEIAYHGNAMFGFPDETYSQIIDELQSMSSIYNVYPVLVQPFIGTKFSSRMISEEQTNLLSRSFREYAESKGMTVYREAA